jgi:hypothetical protein
MDCTRPFSDWAHQFDLSHLLESASVPESQGSGTANYKHGTTCKVCISHARDTISHARASGKKGYSGRARHLGPAFCRMHCCLFMARIYNTYALTNATVIDSGNMTAAEGKDDLDSLTFQYLCD